MGLFICYPTPFSDLLIPCPGPWGGRATVSDATWHYMESSSVQLRSNSERIEGDLLIGMD
jgi:hypothetical protein